MPAYQAGRPRVSSTVTKQNPRPRKYASASERQAAYRARAPEMCFRAEPKTVETLDRIAQTIDQSRADLLLSMTKFALANHDWARFGLTHRPLPYGYGVDDNVDEPRGENPAPIWKRKRPKSLGRPVPLTPKQKAAAKAMAQAAGRPYPNLVDNIAASRLENPTMKKPTPAQLAARARFAEMARSGAFKKKAAKARKAKANPAKKTVSQKISQLTREGYPQKQAVAIALSEERAGKVKRNPNDLLKPVVRYDGWEVSRYKSMDTAVAEARRRAVSDLEYDKPNPKTQYVTKAGRTMYEVTTQPYGDAIVMQVKPADALKLMDLGYTSRDFHEQLRTKRKSNPRASNPAPKFAVGDEVKFTPAVVKRVGGDARTKNMRGVIVEIMGGGKVALVDTRGTFVSEEGNSVRGVPTANLALDVKRNPASGEKRSRTKLNPGKKKTYTVRYLKGGAYRLLARFESLKEATKYATAYANAHNVAVSVGDS